MTNSKWETSQTYIETRVYMPTSTHEIEKVIKEISRERDEYGGEEIEVLIDLEDGLVFRFPAGSTSTGRD